MKLLDYVQRLSQKIGGLRTDVCNLKESVINLETGGRAPTQKGRQGSIIWKICCRQSFQSFKTAFQRFPIGPVSFNKLVLFILPLYNPPSVNFRWTKELLEVVIYSMRDRKLAHETDFERNLYIFRRATVKVWTTNARGDVFNMFGKVASTGTFPDTGAKTIPSQLRDNSVSNLSET